MIVNVCARVLAAPLAEVGAVVERLGDPAGNLWPSPPWPAQTMDRGLEIGSRGGHGPIRYEVVEHEPGRRLRFHFDPAIGIDGYHEFTVRPDGAGTELRHEIHARAHGRMRVAWPLAIRWLHEALLADLLDNAEWAVTGTVRRPARWSPWVRLVRRVMRRGARRAAATTTG